MPSISTAKGQTTRLNNEVLPQKKYKCSITCWIWLANRGWELTRHLDEKKSGPDSVLHVIHCSCKESACEKGRCPCFSAGLCCTDLCRCSNCANTKETEEKEDDNCPDTDSED